MELLQLEGKNGTMYINTAHIVAIEFIRVDLSRSYAQVTMVSGIQPFQINSNTPTYKVLLTYCEKAKVS